MVPNLESVNCQVKPLAGREAELPEASTPFALKLTVLLGV